MSWRWLLEFPACGYLLESGRSLHETMRERHDARASAGWSSHESAVQWGTFPGTRPGKLEYT